MNKGVSGVEGVNETSLTPLISLTPLTPYNGFVQLPLSFSASSIRGSGRGKDLGSPTINLDITQIPDFPDGIYACTVKLADRQENAVMHKGPRPVFDDSDSCEIHLLDTSLDSAPDTLDITVLGFIRDIADFASVEDLKQQILKDIADARSILNA